MLLTDLVATSGRVAATRSRKEKIAALAALLGGDDPASVAVAVGLLIGEVRQGRIGIGWATIGGLDVPPADEPSLTVDDVDRAIDDLQALVGPGSQKARDERLRELFSRATAAEQDFLGRLFVGELRQGALEGLMADAVAVAAGVDPKRLRRASMLGGDLRTVAAAAIAGGEAALDEFRLTVGRAVQPMLASTADDLASALERTGAASVEWKLDGARVQVHKAGDDIRVYTRNLNDVTSRSPEVVGAVRGFPAERLVLDGEVLGLDDAGRPHAFQDTMSRFGTGDASAPTLALGAFFFDVLHADGDDLLDQPLHERQAALDVHVPPRHRIPRLVTDDVDAAAAFLDEALAAGHEGVMVKAIGSTYDAGRRGKQWLKVKPVHTLDLVVLAAEWGHGRRRGWLSNLHLGARDPETGTFVMLGKTFKGLTDELLEWQTARFQELEQDRSPGTVHVRPELVVEIALDGVQRSTRYPGGVALRFARVKGYRPDKSPEEADTIDTVRAMLR